MNPNHKNYQRLTDFAVEEQKNPIKNDSSSLNLHPKEIVLLIKLIESLRELPDDWRGYDDARVSDESISLATYFIRSLPFKKKNYPNGISPNAEGGIILKWIQPKEAVLLLLNEGLLHLAHDYKGLKDDEFVDDVEYNDSMPGSIPEAILSHIPNKNIDA